MRLPRAASLTAVVVLGGYLVVELVHALAERGLARPDDGPLAVIALGYPTPESGRPNAVQRWRAEIAVAALRDRPGIAVFSGGRRRGPAAEADTMAEEARRLGLAEDRIRRETAALSTRQNVALSLQAIEASIGLPGTRIAFASDPLHAARARRLLVQHRPDLAGQLVSAGAYRFGAHPLLKTASVLYELVFGVPDRLRRVRRP